VWYSRSTVTIELILCESNLPFVLSSPEFYTDYPAQLQLAVIVIWVIKQEI